MIILADAPGDVPQFNKLLQHLVRNSRTLGGQFTPVVSRRHRQSIPADVAIFRSRRNRFLHTVATSWIVDAPDSGGAFTALAAVLNPWTNYKGNSQTLTPLDAFHVWAEHFFELVVLGILTFADIVAAQAPFETTWLPKPTWSNLVVDRPNQTIALDYVSGGTLPATFLPQLELYLATPTRRSNLVNVQRSYLVNTKTPGIISHPAGTITWFLPNESLVLPFGMPRRPWTAMARPWLGSWIHGSPAHNTFQYPQDAYFFFADPDPGGP